MYDLLQMDLEFDVFDKDSIYQFVGYGSITQAQYEQLTGQSAPGVPLTSTSSVVPPTSSATSSASSAPSQAPQPSSQSQSSVAQ